MPFKKGEIPEGAKPFTSENQPANRGRPPGARNRSTILRKWLSTELDVTDESTGTTRRGTVEDEVVLALITKARQGDIIAIREVLDTLYGKLTDKLAIVPPEQAAREGVQQLREEFPELPAQQIYAIVADTYNLPIEQVSELEQ